MSEDAYWLKLFALVAIVVTVLIASVAGYNAHANYLVETMVANGADPLKASCAISFGPDCKILMAK